MTQALDDENDDACVHTSMSVHVGLRLSHTSHVTIEEGVPLVRVQSCTRVLVIACVSYRQRAHE